MCDPMESGNVVDARLNSPNTKMKIDKLEESGAMKNNTEFVEEDDDEKMVDRMWTFEKKKRL